MTEKDDMVFEYNSVGTLFYIILSGRVGVYVPKDPAKLKRINSPTRIAKK